MNFQKYEVMVCFTIHLQNTLKFLELYIPPPSYMIALTFFPIWFSTKALIFFEPIKHIKFNFHGVNECFLFKKSMKVILCFALPWNVIIMGPHRYVHTSSNKKIAWIQWKWGLVVFIYTSLGKLQVMISIEI